MFNVGQFRSLIIEPVLSKLQLYSKDAEELLVFTCAAESLGGTLLHQQKGPALGVYLMDPSTYTDIWVNFIRSNNRLATLLGLHFGCNRVPEPERLIYDLSFATAMARIFYLRVKAPIPYSEDIEALWDYYKLHYDTPKGKAKKEQVIENYKDFIK